MFCVLCCRCCWLSRLLLLLPLLLHCEVLTLQQSSRLGGSKKSKVRRGCLAANTLATRCEHAANTRWHTDTRTQTHTSIHICCCVCVLCAVGLSPGTSTLDRAGTLAHAQTIYKATTNVWRCKLSVNLCSDVCQEQGQRGVVRCDATLKDFKCCSHCSCCCCRLHIARCTLHVCCMFPSACQPLYTHRRTGEDMQAYIKLNEA